MNAIEHFKKSNLFDQMDEAEKKRIIEKCQKITVLSGEYVLGKMKVVMHVHRGRRYCFLKKTYYERL